jgi:hypothetical protein
VFAAGTNPHLSPGSKVKMPASDMTTGLSGRLCSAVRLAYNLFTQKPKGEKDDFLNWTSSVKYKQGDDYFRHNVAGEMLVFSAADFEDFRQPRPDMPPAAGRHPQDGSRV